MRLLGLGRHMVKTRAEIKGNVPCPPRPHTILHNKLINTHEKIRNMTPKWP